MRTIINYLRSCFCTHHFAFDQEKVDTYLDGLSFYQQFNYRISATCVKCGYHTSYWKY